jgi:hypothetical protein
MTTSMHSSLIWGFSDWTHLNNGCHSLNLWRWQILETVSLEWKKRVKPLKIERERCQKMSNILQSWEGVLTALVFK